jgi:TolB protein
MHARVLFAAVPFLFASSAFPAHQTPVAPATVGIFQGSTDIGHAQLGSTTWDPATHSYLIQGGGADIWGSADDLRFTWTALSGDASLAADVRVAQPPTHQFAKGVLMFRQSLDPGSPYADIAIHADGHITLQWRAVANGETKDITLAEHNASRLRIERQGDRFTAFAITAGQQTSAPPSITIPLKDPVYVGIGVCSHNTGALQSVTFSNVTLEHTTISPH